MIAIAVAAAIVLVLDLAFEQRAGRGQPVTAGDAEDRVAGEDGVHDRAGHADIRDPAGGDARLRLATWNVKRLGHGDKRLDRVVAVIARFDVVALQEVMTREVIDDLLRELPGWRAAMCEKPLGRGRYREWYAVLYRADRISVERAFTAPDRADEFAREPFVVCMRADRFDFCLIDIHVVYGRGVGERDREITALAARARALRDAGEEKDWIVAGDFNRAPTARSWRAFTAAGWRHTTAGKLATTLGVKGYRNAYDHILVDPAHTGERITDAARVDIGTDQCGGDHARCSRELSDHAPLMVEFRTDGADDDGPVQLKP